MKLESLTIKNFRCFKNQTILFNKYACLVGPNGAGKSTILTALNILFRQKSNVSTDVQLLTEEDFHNRVVTDPITIEATFADLSATAAEELKHYVRQGKLVIKAKAEWNAENKSADVQHFGARFAMEDFRDFFEKYKIGEKKDVLDKTYNDLLLKFPDLPKKASSKDAKKDALNEYEAAHPEKCVLLDSADQFFGFQGAGKLDPHIQWVYIPAVKDASSEQEEAKNTAFGLLLERTIKSKMDFKDLQELERTTKETYEKILRSQDEVLESVSSSLEGKLKAWAHPAAKVELKWNFDPQKSVRFDKPNAKAAIGEREFLGDIRRMGHGLQRAFIVSVLQELATCNPDVSPTLLLGFEEPELYQHPPQARHLAKLLEEMENTQVVLTTHSPYFIPGKHVEDARLIRWKSDTAESTVSFLTLEGLSARLASALGGKPLDPSPLMASTQQIMQPSLRELFFCGLAVLVEGVEDVAYISAHMELAGYDKEFRRIGGHFIICGGKNTMSRPLAIACELSIPHFIVFDGDSDRKKPDEVSNNIRDNSCLLNLCAIKDFDPTCCSGHSGKNIFAWGTKIGDAIKADLGTETWDKAKQEVMGKYNYQNVNGKNEMLITATLEHLWGQGVKSSALDDLCNKIITAIQQ